MLQITIVERDIGSYFEGRTVIKTERSLSEDDIVLSLQQNLEGLTSLDLHKGIKELWEQDLIDTQNIRWKKPKSTTSEAMDEPCTLKSDYPHVYKEIQNQPLFKTSFKFLKDVDKYVSHFAVDPAKGFLAFTMFPKGKGNIENVIRKILEHN